MRCGNRSVRTSVYSLFRRTRVAQNVAPKGIRTRRNPISLFEKVDKLYKRLLLIFPLLNVVGDDRRSNGGLEEGVQVGPDGDGGILCSTGGAHRLHWCQHHLHPREEESGRWGHMQGEKRWTCKVTFMYLVNYPFLFSFFVFYCVWYKISLSVFCSLQRSFNCPKQRSKAQSFLPENI